MSIQSQMNSLLGTIGQMSLFYEGSKHFKQSEEHIKKVEKNTEPLNKYFGSMAKIKQERQSSILDMKKTKERQGMDPADRVAEGQQRILQKEYEDSGQAEADALAEAMYNEQMTSAGEAKALQNVVTKTETFRNQRENLPKRKEYLRKPRILNRHGVIMQEVMKDGK